MSSFHCIGLDYFNVAKLVMDTLGGEDAAAQSGHVQGWHRSGQKSMEGHLVSGAPHGAWNLWHRNGLLWQEVTFVHGAMSDQWRVWYKSGAIWIEGNFEMGLRHKRWTFNWPNGLPMARGCFQKDKMSGTWDYWTEVGNFLGQADFIDGLQVDCRPYEDGYNLGI